MVVLTHLRTGRDLRFYYEAMQRNLHIDVMLGGHDHYQAYLKLTYNGRRTYLVKTGANGNFVARLQLSSSDAGATVVQLVPVLSNSQCAAEWARTGS